jgi:hypothetical protein
MDRRLNWLGRWRRAAHLKACEGCRNFQKQISFPRMAFRNHPVVEQGREGKKGFSRPHPVARLLRTSTCRRH